MNVNGWFVDSIYIASETGVDAYGRPSFSTPRLLKVRWEDDSRLITGADGEEHQSNHKFATQEEITQQDRLWKPGVDPADASESLRPILVTAAARKGGGQKLYEVFL